MSKLVDDNGYWYIKRNPISKVGVFPYLGRTISDECVPDKIYYVLRPAETLRDSVPTWDNPPKPFIENHEMLGEGFSKIDERPVQGIIYNPEYDEKDGVLYADLAIYSEDMKDKIAEGKKEISLGYFCKYVKEPGVYNGQVYDYVQKDMVGNHGALVDSGRCGSDVKVFDHKCTMDSVDINPTDFQAKDGTNENLLNKNPDSVRIDNEQEVTTDNSTEEKMADKREFIRKIMAIAAKADGDFEGGEEEKIKTIAKLLEESEYAKSEDEDDAEKEEKETTDKCGKDEDDADKEDEKKAEDSDVVSAAEVMAWLKTISEQLTALTSRSAAKDEDDEEKKEEKAEDEDEEEKKDSEDEDDSEKEDDKKTSEDSAVFVFGKAAQNVAEDAALKAYLS